MGTTVLTFGHIPKHYGGRQQSGLANAVWAVASNMPDREGHFHVVFCATDIMSRSTCIGGLPVIGWTRISLLAGIARSPVRFLRRLVKLARLCERYDLPLVRTALKTLQLEQAIAIVKPDFLHLHGCDAAVYLEAGVFDPAKTFVTLHGVHGETGQRSLFMMEEALSRVPLKFLAFVTNKIQTEWRETFGQATTPAVVIPNAFDDHAFFLAEEGVRQKGGAKNFYRLVSVGSIGDNKGQGRIIEAMIRFKTLQSSYDVDYTMIGNGEPNLVVRFLSRAAGAGIRVRHLPYLAPPEIRAELSEADFMILASAKEGFGIVFLESIACGVPVVLPKNLPICEEPGLISDQNAVLLYSSSTEAILEFLVKLPSYAFVADKVAATVPRYSWQNVGARYRAMLGSQP